MSKKQCGLNHLFVKNIHVSKTLIGWIRLGLVCVNAQPKDSSINWVNKYSIRTWIGLVRLG